MAADAGAEEAHAGLAEVRERTGDAAGARKEAQAALELKPSASAYLVLARLDFAASHLSEANHEASEALKLNPNSQAAQELLRQVAAKRRSPGKPREWRSLKRRHSKERAMPQIVRRIRPEVSPMLRACGLPSAGRRFAACHRFTAPPPSSRVVEEFVLDDTIQPVTAGQLDRAIARANSEGRGGPADRAQYTRAAWSTPCATWPAPS